MGSVEADLAEVLKLLHESDRRWRTLTAEGEEWRDEERSGEAFIRRRPPGGVISFRGGPDQDERDPRWQLWVRQPDRSRVEFGAVHGARVTEITSADRTWMRLPDGRSHIQQRQPSGGPAFGPASCLVQTRAIPGAFNLEVAATDDVVGRACVAVRARPVVVNETPPGPGFHPLLQGADEVRLTVDAERGVVLRVEALLDGVVFYRNAMTAVRFDEDLPDEVFAFPVADEPTPAGGPPRGATGPSRRPPVSRPGGPPDDMLGETVPVGRSLVRSDSVLVVLDRVVAYPEGFELYVSVRTRDEQVAGATEPMHPRSWSGTTAFPGESLRLGVVFADGRRSFTDNFAQGTRASGIMLAPLNGVGTTARFDQRFWVRPLPPTGPVGLIVEWKARGIAETGVEIPAEVIIEAASRATRIWRTS